MGPINPPMTDGEAWDDWYEKISHPAYGEG